MESGILGVRIQNPSSTDKDLKSSTWNLESMAWNPEYNTVLDSLTRGERQSEHCFLVMTVLRDCYMNYFLFDLNEDGAIIDDILHENNNFLTAFLVVVKDLQQNVKLLLLPCYRIT